MADPAELIQARDDALVEWREIDSAYMEWSPNYVAAKARFEEAHAALLAALTPPTSAEDAAVLDDYDVAVYERDAAGRAKEPAAIVRLDKARATVLARMAGKVPEGSVVLPKQALEALYMRLWARHEHLDDGPPDFEPVRQPWTPDDDAALKAVAKYLFAAPEAPR